MAIGVRVGYSNCYPVRVRSIGVVQEEQVYFILSSRWMERERCNYVRLVEF